jgi:uracil-DNA glycosylase family 4
VNTKEEYNSLLNEILEYVTTGFHDSLNSRTHSVSDTGASRIDCLKDIEEEILRCTKCPLHRGRINAVPGKGSYFAGIIFVGEGPGEMEDIKGEPFVGRAGQLLTKMLAAIHLTREEVFITNVVKCRPPNNRTPQPEEVATCFSYLERQIELIDPFIICCLGGPAARTMIGSDAGVSKLRGTIHQYKNIAVIPTYHPAAVLRFPERYKRHVWNDLKLLRDYYKDVRK